MLHLDLSITYMSSVEFVMKTWTICCWAFCSQTTHFGDFYLFVCKGQLKMYKVLKCMCWNIILPIRISVWLYPFCCCDCCLLNLSPYHQVELYHSLFLIRVLFHPQLPSPPSHLNLLSIGFPSTFQYLHPSPVPPP